jgi:hypothetical protein
VLTGDVTGHPILGTAEVVTSRLCGIDASAGWARTLSRWYHLGPRRTEPRPYPFGFWRVDDLDQVAAALTTYAALILLIDAGMRDQ